MKKTLVSLFALVLMAVSLPAMAQPVLEVSNAYVRNSTTVPEFWDQKQGWEHVKAEDRHNPDLNTVIEYYVDAKRGLMAYVLVKNGKDGSRQELAMRYGTPMVGRSAIKVDGKWYVARLPFYDEPNSMPENDFKEEDFLDSTGKLVSVKMTLDTVDGPKVLDVVFKN